MGYTAALSTAVLGIAACLGAVGLALWGSGAVCASMVGPNLRLSHMCHCHNQEAETTESVLAIGLKAFLERMKSLVTQQMGFRAAAAQVAQGAAPWSIKASFLALQVVTVNGGTEGTRDMEGAEELGLIFQ